MPMSHQRLMLGDRAAPARLAATTVVLCGLAAIAGWMFGIRDLTSVFPGSVEMKINTAVALVACGAALILLTDRVPLSSQRLGQVLGLLVATLGAATLAEYCFAWDLGIDELLMRDRPGVLELNHGRMSPYSAAALTMFGFALAALPVERLRLFAAVAAALTIGVGVISLLGYLWNATELLTERRMPPVALNSAACFVLLGTGMLVSPRRLEVALDDKIDALAAVEIKILGGFILALALLLIGGSYTYRSNAQFARSVEWVAHTQEVRASLASLYGSVAGAEVALRDYVLTNDAAHLNEYKRLTAEVRTQLASVAALTVDNPTQRDSIVALQPLVTARLAAMAGTYSAYRDFGLLAARAVIADGRKLNATQDVRALIDTMDATEARLLRDRQAATASVRHATLVSLLLTLVIASALFGLLFRGIHKEMLARREVEGALRASAAYNRSIIDSSPDCLGILDLQGRLLQMTPEGQRLMEIDDFGSVAGIDWPKIWKGAERRQASSALAAARAGNHGRFQGFCPTLKGSPKWWDVIVMPIVGPSGEPERLLSVSRDISDVKRAESTLVATNRFLDSLFESLPLMVFVKDARTLRYVRLNKACEQAAGRSREEMIGKTAHDLVPREEADAIVAKDREALVTGRLVEVPEETVQSPLNGARTRHTMKLPLCDEHGRPEYLLGISVDITERKLAEQAIHELNSALIAKAEQLETTNQELESFSYSVSHDLRAPLRAIDGFALMIEEDYSHKLDAEGRRYLSVIRDNSRRMGALIDDLLAFSRLGRLPLVAKEVNVDSLVREVVQEILSHHGTAPPHIDIEPLPPSRGDRTLLRQVWMNLIANAVKYSSKSAHPTIEVRGYDNGVETYYSVRDNGVGFDMEYVEKLFGVFQRLHRADEFAGTGVGLAIVHRVVTRHGGRVWAEGRVNDGATFWFALPKGVSSG